MLSRCQFDFIYFFVFVFFFFTVKMEKGIVFILNNMQAEYPQTSNDVRLIDNFFSGLGYTVKYCLFIIILLYCVSLNVFKLCHGPFDKGYSTLCYLRTLKSDSNPVAHLQIRIFTTCVPQIKFVHFPHLSQYHFNEINVKWSYFKLIYAVNVDFLVRSIAKIG
jgi:hypothetical protein